MTQTTDTSTPPPLDDMLQKAIAQLMQTATQQARDLAKEEAKARLAELLPHVEPAMTVDTATEYLNAHGFQVTPVDGEDAVEEEPGDDTPSPIPPLGASTESLVHYLEAQGFRVNNKRTPQGGGVWVVAGAEFSEFANQLGNHGVEIRQFPNGRALDGRAQWQVDCARRYTCLA